MNKFFFIFVFYIVCYLVHSNEITTNVTVVTKSVKLNDILDLECNSNHKEINKTVVNSTGLNGFDIFIFKKDSVLVNLFRSKLRIKISNFSDQGLYECGFYRFDKHGTLNYVYQNTWLINITIPDEVPLRYAALNVDLQTEVNLNKVNLNILAQYPVKIAVIGILLLGVLFTIILLLIRNNLPFKSNGCVKLQTENNKALFKKFIKMNV